MVKSSHCTILQSSLALLFLILIVTTGYPNIFVNTNAQTENSTQLITFRDNVTGLTMQYPPDWQVLSEKYAKIMFGSALEGLKKQDPNYELFENLTRPIAVMFPKAFSGTNLMIIYQALPFPMSAEAFMNASLASVNSTADLIDKTSSVSVGGVPGSRVDMSFNNVKLSQIFLTKDDTGLVIQFIEGAEQDRQKNLADVNTIVKSIKIP